MDTQARPQTDPADGFRDYRRAAHQLRRAAFDIRQSDERKRWIRAATRC